MSKKQIERIRATLYNLRIARINEKEALEKIREIIYNGKKSIKGSS